MKICIHSNLKKVWEYEDPTLFNKEDRRFTSEEFTAYWGMVDKAVKFAETIAQKGGKEETNCTKFAKLPIPKPLQQISFSSLQQQERQIPLEQRLLKILIHC